MMRMWRRRGLGFGLKYNFRFRRKNYRNHSLLLVMITIVLLTTFTFSYFERRIKPTVSAMAEVKSRYIAIAAINNVVYQQINEDNITYEDLVFLEKNNDGYITALQANVVRMNQMKSEIAIRVQQEIAKIDSTKISIPIGNIINGEILSGWGPRLPIQLMPLGSAETDFNSSFESAGINQTKHQIAIIVKSKVRVILPLITTEAEVVTTVPIAETIIVGTVPQQYVNVEGTGSMK